MAEKEYIEREAFLDAIERMKPYHQDADDIAEMLQNFPAADVRPVPEGGIGEMSDGYHTFNGLYYQRMVLFAALVNDHKDKAWKSWKHEDGKPCFDGGWFIVGIDTPQGSYTYHYEAKDFDLFDCVELPVAKHWDGHTEENVTRLLSLPDVRPVVLCKDCLHYESKNKRTNAMKIRSMTDEELADWLGVYCNGQTAQEVGKPCVSDMGSCEECWLDWLKQEAEE